MLRGAYLCLTTQCEDQLRDDPLHLKDFQGKFL